MEIKGLYKELESKEKKIAVRGLGYVGLPLLIGFSKHFQVIGFDTSSEKIKNLKNGIDENKEIETEKLSSLDCILTSNASDLKNANFFIIAVPTPIDNYKNPDLSHIKEATILVGKNMPEGSIVVYESTVYPGVTEEFCIPLLEKESKLKNKEDFYVGYSPERINPGEKKHTIENIIKVVSAQTESSLGIISKVYGKVVKAGIYKAKSIKVAEAAKVIENTQRDINVALINELAILFSKLGIDTKEVLETAGTKWNFLDFKPGLVGGHCIGVDPYYLSFKAREINYYPEIINTGRKINDKIFDPVVNTKEVKENYGIDLIKFEEINDIDAAIFCVAHNYFKEMDLRKLKLKMAGDNPVIFDIKWIFDKEDIEKLGYRYWRI